MAELEVRQLRYFVAVAEELHFGRAALRLGMAQPPLSRAIRNLERMLGVVLFERTTRQVGLTRAGEVLLRDAKNALEAVGAAARRTQSAGRVEPELRVALKADYDAGLLPDILRVYDTDDAAVPVELVLGGRGEQVPALRDGRADVALVATPFESVGLDTEALLTEPRLLALAAGDELCAYDTLSLEQLRGRILPDGSPAEAGLSPTDVTSYESLELALPTRGPGRPTPQTLRDLAAIFSLVELGRVVLFVPTSVAHRHSRPDITYRTVRELPPAVLTVAWPQQCRLPAVAAFVRAAGIVAAARNIEADTGATAPMTLRRVR